MAISSAKIRDSHVIRATPSFLGMTHWGAQRREKNATARKRTIPHRLTADASRLHRRIAFSRAATSTASENACFGRFRCAKTPIQGVLCLLPFAQGSLSRCRARNAHGAKKVLLFFYAERKSTSFSHTAREKSQNPLAFFIGY